MSVYRVENGIPDSYGGYSVLSGSYVINDSNTGFYGAVYYSPADNSVVAAIQGTNTGQWQDQATNIAGPVSDLWTFQERQAFQLLGMARTLAAAKHADLSITGHSLGGFLVQQLLIANPNASATVFNSPGIFGFMAEVDISDQLQLWALGGRNITYVYSNPASWSEAQFSFITAGNIHNLGLRLGDNIVFLPSATGHRMGSLLSALEGGDTPLSASEMDALLRQPSFWEGFLADASHEIRSIEEGWLHEAMRQAAMAQCFPAHTRIQTSRTTSTAISALRVGDMVLAFDARADKGRGALVPRRVTRLYRNTITDWIRLRWVDDTAREGVATPGHHFLDEFGGFPTTLDMTRTGSATVVLASGALTQRAVGCASGQVCVRWN